jgi:hypothetical protein
MKLSTHVLTAAVLVLGSGSASSSNRKPLATGEV